MPATTLATPIVLQQTSPVPTTQYYMLQPSTIFPTVPFVNTAFVYPSYNLVTKKDENEKSQIQESIY